MAEDEEAKAKAAWESIIEPHREDLLMMSGPVLMAQHFANTMAEGRNAGMELRIPTAAEEWAQDILNRYFETVAKIAQASGIRRKLIDRGLFDPALEGAPEWNEGLTLDELDPINRDDYDHWEEYEEMEILDDVYGPFAVEPSFLRRFGGRGGEEEGMAGGGYALLHCTIVCSSCAI